MARKHLEKSRDMMRYEKLGPSNTLVEFMRSFNFVAPQLWRGYHALAER